MSSHTRFQHTSGFTVVELVVVIVILAILVIITSFTFTSIRTETAKTVLKDDVKRGSTAIESYKSNNGGYPTTLASVNNGKGISASGTNTYRYVQVPTNEYCLEARGFNNTLVFSYDSQSDEVRENVACP